MLHILGLAASTLLAPQSAESPAPAGDTEPCCVSAPLPQKGPLLMDRKSVGLRQLAKRVKESTAPFLGEGAVAILSKKMKELPPTANGYERFNVGAPLADALLNYGDIEGAIKLYETCRAFAASVRDKQTEIKIMRKLAVANIRLGERRNCVAHHNQDSCIFPLSKAAVHVERQGSEEAIVVLEQLLTATPDDLSALWLLNVAHMTLGSWPDGVPEKWRIPASAFAAEADLGRFHDIAPKLGLNSFARAGGSIMDDFDGDGRLDILTSSMSSDEPLRLFHHNPDGTFQDVAADVRLSGQLGGLQLFAQDVNNDGRLDVLVQRGAWMHQHGKMPNSLMIQQADGTFVDRTLEACIEIAAPSQVAAFADIDNDGDLDLFLGYEQALDGHTEDAPSRMFRNRGDGTFEDITELAGVRNDRFCKGAAFGDYDGDRLPDLYVSNLGGPNRLYRNQGSGVFVDVAEQLGVQHPIESFSCSWVDYNNDGWLDLWVSCYGGNGGRTAEVAAWYRDRNPGSDTMRLYENDRHGHFRDVTRLRGMARIAFPMGSNFGDIDNDGYPDLYLATGDPEFSSLWPNVLLHNTVAKDGGRSFEDVTASTGTGHLQKGHGVSFGDIDGDGDQDFFVQMGGAFKDDAFWSTLYENPGHGNHWLTLRLKGTQSNRFGIGARVRTRIEEPQGMRDVYAFVGTNSSFGGNSLQQEIGLGKATRIVELEIFWPKTGKTQMFRQVPLDSVISIEEDSKTFRLVEPSTSHP